MFQRYVFLTLSLILVLALLLTAGCQSSTPSRTTAAAQTQAPAPAAPATQAAAKTYELILSDHNPDMAPPAKAHEALKKYIEEKSAGRIKVTRYLGGALLGEAEAYRGVQTGVADMALYVLNNKQGFKLNTVVQLPFMGWPSRLGAGQIYMQLLKEFPDMAAEWKDVKIISSVMMPPTGIHTTRKAVKTLADLKGMSIATTGEMSQLISAMGASPNEIAITEQTSSLQKGLIEGTHNHISVLKVFGMIEVLKYHIFFGDGGINMSPLMIIINEAKLKSMPADLQQIILDSGKAYEESFYGMEQGFWDSAIDDARKLNNTLIYLTPAEIQPFADAVKGPIIDTWIKGNGANAQAIYNRAVALTKK